MRDCDYKIKCREQKDHTEDILAFKFKKVTLTVSTLKSLTGRKHNYTV